MQSFDKWLDASSRSFQLALQAHRRECAAPPQEAGGDLGTASQLAGMASRHVSRCSDDSAQPGASAERKPLHSPTPSLAHSPSHRSSVMGLGKQSRAPRLVVQTYLQVRQAVFSSSSLCSGTVLPGLSTTT